MDILYEMTAALRAEAHHPPCVMQSSGFCTEHSSKSRSVSYEEERSPTLRAGVVPGAATENLPDDRVKTDDNASFFTLFTRFPCIYYTIFEVKCLVFQGFWDCSIHINWQLLIFFEDQLQGKMASYSLELPQIPGFTAIVFRSGNVKRRSPFRNIAVYTKQFEYLGEDRSYV